LTDSSARTFAIVGNGIAGTSAAEIIRKNDPNARIVLIAAEPYPLYNRIALPPFLKRKVAQQKVMIRDLAWHDRMNVELRLNTRVTQVDAERKILATDAGAELRYDALLIATGSRAICHPACVDGQMPAGMYSFQTLDDAIAIDKHLETAASAVAVGGSYISYELCEAFNQRGVKTSWLMRGPWFLRRVLEGAGGELVSEIARHHGVTMLHGQEVASIETAGGAVTALVTDRNERVDADLVGVGVGVQRNVEFLAGSGIETRRGVVTDEKLRTNAPGVYAAGDVAEFFDPYIKMHNLMGTWDNGVSQGRLAGRNMLGADEPFDEVPTYATTLFDNRIVAFGATPESDPEVEDVWTIDTAEQTYRRLFFLGDRLVGGVIIKDKRGRAKLIELIHSRTSIPKEDRRQLLELQ
jgi:NAD(P)H-nitrite reductase large subunit